MLKTDFIKYVVLFCIIIFLQVFVFNNIVFRHIGYAMPIIYIYPLLKLPITINRNILIFIGFFLGFIIDIFCDTLGVNAAVSTFIAYLRQPLISAYVKDENKRKAKEIPGISTWRFMPFLGYITILTTIQISLITFLENIYYFNWKFIIPQIISSIVISILIIITIDKLFGINHKN